MMGKSERQANDEEEQDTVRQMMGKSERERERRERKREREGERDAETGLYVSGGRGMLPRR
jgi:hypothetical protein